MSTMSNKNKVRILKAARRLIESGRYDYICQAIEDVEYRLTKEGVPKDGWDLRYLISEILQGHHTLEDWLWREHGIMAHNGCKLKLRETRLAWIDSLIEEFS